MRALILSGGASKGAFQIGVLKRWMGDMGIDYDVLVGVSVGALNIAGLAQSSLGKPREAIERVERFWLERVDTKKVYDRWFPFGRLHSLWSGSLYDTKPLRNLVDECLKSDLIRASGRQLAVGAVCLDTGECKFKTQRDENFDKWILASASLPVFMEPVEIDGKLWSDGGIKQVIPLTQAIDMGATEIDVVLCYNFESRPWVSKTRRAVPDQILRTVDLMFDQLVKNDAEILSLKNELSLFSDKHKRVKIRIAMPKTNLVENSLSFDKSDIVRMIKAGYELADDAVVYRS